VPPAVAQLNYISSGILWRIFPKLGYFAGFSLIIIFFVGPISAAAIAGDLIFFCLGGPVGDYTGAHTLIFRGIFLFMIRQVEHAKLKWAERGWGAGKRDIIFLA
jgi:hypothetical protein